MSSETHVKNTGHELVSPVDATTQLTGLTERLRHSNRASAVVGAQSVDIVGVFLDVAVPDRHSLQRQDRHNSSNFHPHLRSGPVREQGLKVVPERVGKRDLSPRESTGAEIALECAVAAAPPLAPNRLWSEHVHSDEVVTAVPA